ncbi:DUF4865 family protein [Pseudonocardia spinosispora]|uniref:DUF4865 family protein n=1 Tax=Pseudonocardia spinosispora TaxID=103441 RepID=UPI00040DAEA5|nr:DUF4865 family protein [Pseudonocardia spinosispora]
MLAMQYEITLPADYDMSVIRTRIATRGHLLDTYQGLGLKAYLVREVGVHGSPVNQYAPFYLWRDTAGTAGFLWRGDGFGGIVRDFGRPVVRTWVGGRFGFGTAQGAEYATKVVCPLEPDVDPVEVATRADAELAELRTRPGVYAAAFAVDPTTWQLVRFTLWEQAPAEWEGTLYDVGHLSSPEIAEL